MTQDHQKISENETQITAANINRGTAAVQLKDNREHSVVQQKLAEKTANLVSSFTPVQAKENTTELSDNLKSGINSEPSESVEKSETSINTEFRDFGMGSQNETDDQKSAEKPKHLEKQELSPEKRKKMAHEWVQQKINTTSPTPIGLREILTSAINNFNLSRIEIDEADEKKLNILYYASPGDRFSLILNKPIGNNLSDLALGVGGRFWSAIVGNRTEHGKAKPVYGPLTGRGMGTFMQINGLTKANMPPGSATDSDELADSNSLYKTLKKRRLPGTQTTYYVAGHLLRGKLGGSGSDWENLAPITQSTNNYSSASHLHQVEDEVSALVGTTPITYRVQAIYGRWPWEWPSYFSHLIRYGGTEELNEVLAAEDHIPTGFSCQWLVQGGAGSWIPYSRFIRQWRFENGESYEIKVASGNNVDFANQIEVWDYLQIPIKLAIGALLWSTFPLLPTLLSSPHLLRGLAANALTDYFARSMDFVNSKEGGTRIAARRAEIGALSTGLSLFGIPQIQMLDPIITFAVGNLSKLSIDNQFELEKITSEVVEKTSQISGLMEWLKDPQILKGVVAGVIDCGNNPAVRHGIKKTIGATASNKCKGKTAKNKSCKNSVCNAAKQSGERLCSSHYIPK